MRAHQVIHSEDVASLLSMRPLQLSILRSKLNMSLNIADSRMYVHAEFRPARDGQRPGLYLIWTQNPLKA